MTKHLSCSLCGANKVTRIDPGHDFYHCLICDLRFRDPAKYLSFEDEKYRYLTHNNDVNDSRYRKFVEPLYNEIIKRIPPGKKGLDYGAGPGPVLAVMLEEQNYKVDLYDPIFHADKSRFLESYDFIVASESVEHFYNPKLEFTRIRQAISKNGFFSLMTLFYQPSTDLTKWFYAKDPCHVVFYSDRTLEWIKQEFDFKSLEIVSDRVAVFGT